MRIKKPATYLSRLGRESTPFRSQFGCGSIPREIYRQKWAWATQKIGIFCMCLRERAFRWESVWGGRCVLHRNPFSNIGLQQSCKSTNLTPLDRCSRIANRSTGHTAIWPVDRTPAPPWPAAPSYLLGFRWNRRESLGGWLLKAVTRKGNSPPGASSAFVRSPTFLDSSTPRVVPSPALSSVYREMPADAAA